MTSRRDGLLNVTVQHGSGGGSLLLAYLDPHALYRRGDRSTWSYSRQGRMVGPGLICRLINHALGNGWRADEHSQQPFEIAVWTAEDVAQGSGGSVPEPGEVHLREIATNAVSDLRFDLSLDPVWRKTLIAAAPKERYEIPPDFQGTPETARAHGLRFHVFNDGWTEDGLVVFGIESAEFPSVVMYTTNNPSWPLA
jgi:hypothetical protein